MLLAFIRSHASVAAAPPAKVKCPDEEHVCLRERLVMEHSLSVVRICAGAFFVI